jgi:hypothetical protein
VFVTIYKTLMVIQRRLRGKESSLDAFVAGVIGGWIVFGKNDNINMQVRPKIGCFAADCPDRHENIYQDFSSFFFSFLEDRKADGFPFFVFSPWPLCLDFLPPPSTQIVLYLFSRISMGLAQLAVKKGMIPNPPNSFPVFAAVVWGIVMWLFRHERDTLQGSLQASMQYLYNDSEKWDGLRNWIWHNK